MIVSSPSMNSLSCIWIQNAGSNSSYYIIKVNLLTFPENKALWPGRKHGTGGVAGQGGEGDEIKAGLQPACAGLGGKRKWQTSGSDVSVQRSEAKVWTLLTILQCVVQREHLEHACKVYLNQLSRLKTSSPKKQWEMTLIVLNPRLGNTVEKVIFYLT